MGSNNDTKRTQGHPTEGLAASKSILASHYDAHRPYDFPSSAVSRAGIGAQFTDQRGFGVNANRSSGHPYPQTLKFDTTNENDQQGHVSARNVQDIAYVPMSRTEGLNTQTEPYSSRRAERLVGQGQERVHGQDQMKEGHGADRFK